ncbi:hypothetical protein [Salinicoccus carnicancri]|uniref:hypothetical protein n=1 Tax=Salinicoccus carnicancri TaxID=558170 RepID=UPI00037952F2|nr:hypothetical protein [Salinicoccus carnicancri]
MTKKLLEFQNFEAERFLKDKTLLAMKSEVLKNQNRENIGAKYTIIVWEDNTKYKDESVSNVGDTYNVKIEGKEPLDIDKPVQVKLVNPVGKVWGDFNSNLSLSASDLRFIEGKVKDDGTS